MEDKKTIAPVLLDVAGALIEGVPNKATADLIDIANHANPKKRDFGKIDKNPVSPEIAMAVNAQFKEYMQENGIIQFDEKLNDMIDSIQNAISMFNEYGEPFEYLSLMELVNIDDLYKEINLHKEFSKPTIIEVLEVDTDKVTLANDNNIDLIDDITRMDKNPIIIQTKDNYDKWSDSIVEGIINKYKYANILEYIDLVIKANRLIGNARTFGDVCFNIACKLINVLGNKFDVVDYMDTYFIVIKKHKLDKFKSIHNFIELFVEQYEEKINPKLNLFK